MSSLQAVIEIPYALIQSIIYGIIVYSMIGFEWTVSKFFYYLMFMYLTFLYFTFHGMMIVAITPNNTISAVVSSAFYPLWNVISGYLIPKTVSAYTKCVCIYVFYIHMFVYQYDGIYSHQSSGGDRDFLYGGDGSIGLARPLGVCMDYLVHSLEALWTHLMILVKL